MNRNVMLKTDVLLNIFFSENKGCNDIIHNTRLTIRYYRDTLSQNKDEGYISIIRLLLKTYGNKVTMYC